ncbi:efflux RND transporter periplasmic adaptor subunit [Brucella pseudogrignonensis]|jgi:RND family efflux transporter MFP subunit|uniref:Efflux RND transporter periplasmic adaptor subunit n=1 Tax=Brucella pseudogrignonensis TaxID=419475 RepID=A0A256GKP2_9HYPH|nr:efflux RND transporter periplasmic adaptor subunit [Brucella pseudogrignonensis]EMG55526.1 RND family efflux transporter MFP subunit [Ochrobactrum sp. CDB2]QWK77903.1 efflux RND transporter periplasmic adaptor subunit [Ochrobactrum sp. BTU1]MCM0751698.1 efflux RND transporter periplasmic adaptor subunit [Brucella pseudogrignonensis]NNV21116.1 efflux RND transporter periplasmic adaptor subunit [Brucella pseudogrignonensis]OYR27416.1 efflux transporter, RND family, MFP subunit [Brucella pseud
MKSWKQIVLCLLIIIVAGGGWYIYKNKDSSTQTASGEASGQQKHGAQSGGSSGRAAPLVVVEPAGEETINNRLTAIGSARALSTVSVTPYSSGYMNELLVKAGDAIKAGDPIAILDNETETIAVNKAQIALKDAETTRQRIARLRSTNTATVVQEVEADLALSNAKLALDDAQLALSRRTVRAPITGIVGILPVNAGNYVTAQTSIARIDDRSKVLIDIWVPERFAPQIKVGQPLTAESTAFPGVTDKGEINAVDNMLDEASRTLHVRAEINNEQDRLRAGMSFSVTVLFPGNSYPSVDPLAIQWGADGSYVWRVEEGVAKKVSARIVQRNSTNILIDGAVKEGDMIVTQGVQTVRDDAPVRLQDEQGTARIDPAAKSRVAG